MQTSLEFILEGTPPRRALGPNGVPGQIILGFIVDSYYHKAALVIEVNGDIHDLQHEEDARQEKVLSELGLRIVQFRNDVLKNLSTVLEKLN